MSVWGHSTGPLRQCTCKSIQRAVHYVTSTQAIAEVLQMGKRRTQPIG